MDRSFQTLNIEVTSDLESLTTRNSGGNDKTVKTTTLPLFGIPMESAKVSSFTFGFVTLSISSFSSITFLASYAATYASSNGFEKSTMQNVLYAWIYFTLVNWILVPLWQNYRLIPPQKDPVSCEEGCIYCRCCYVCVCSCCCCRYTWESRSKSVNKSSRYIPGSIYNLLFMVLNPGYELDTSAPPTTEDIPFSRAYLTMLCVSMEASLNLYKFVNAIVVAGYSGTGVGLALAILSVLSAAVNLKLFFISMGYGILLLPYTIGWSIGFFCKVRKGSFTVKSGTWAHSRICELWRLTSPVRDNK